MDKCRSTPAANHISRSNKEAIRHHSASEDYRILRFGTRQQQPNRGSWAVAISRLTEEPLAANCVEITGFVIVDKTGQGWLVQFFEHVAKLLLVAMAAREALTVGFPERTDQGPAVLAANLAALAAASRINCHFIRLLRKLWP